MLPIHCSETFLFPETTKHRKETHLLLAHGQSDGWFPNAKGMQTISKGTMRGARVSTIHHIPTSTTGGFRQRLGTGFVIGTSRLGREATDEPMTQFTYSDLRSDQTQISGQISAYARILLRVSHSKQKTSSLYRRILSRDR